MSAIAQFLGVAREPRAYLSVLYLLSRLPVGWLYLTVLVVGVAFGLSLALIGVGLVVLALTMVAAWGFGSLERELARWWLGQAFRPRWLGDGPGRGLRRLSWMMTNPLTWKSLVFLLLQFPAGVILFVLLAGLLSLTLACLLAPVAYLLDAVTFHGSQPYPSLWAEALRWLGLGWATTGPAASIPLLAFVLTGCLVALGILHLSRSLGRWYGRFASTMLAVSETEVDLALARQEAATQGARAERLEQGRRELVMNISHDLRTPIASIQGHVAAMLENKSAPAESRRYLAVVARESDRLGTLVEDLLLLARSDVGELELDLRPVDVAGVVREVAAALTPIARRDRRIALTCSVADPVPAAQADAERLTQVLMNLARNAIVYTPEGGIVSIEAAAHGTQQVAIVVADTGVGIPPEDVERIFERFVRSDASRSRETGGFGLGLAIARDLVTAMGGTVTVRSEPRQGSQFTVLLRRA